MKKRWISLLLCGAVAATAACGFAACGEGGGGGGEGGGGEGGGSNQIMVWGPGHEQSFIEGRLNAYKAAYEAENGTAYPYELKFGDVGEDSAENKFTNNAAACADVYHFASNQLMSLMELGGLAQISPAMEERIKANDMGEVVAACKIGDGYYAYPYTSDNGFCLFYDKNVVTMTAETTLEDVINMCKAAGKLFIMPLGDAFYVGSFIYGAGGDYTANYDANGHFVSSTTTFAQTKPGSQYSYGQLGGDELSWLWSLTEDPGYKAYILSGGNAQVNSALDNQSVGAAVTGTWEATQFEDALGSDFGASALPNWVSRLDGQTYPWIPFIGFKMIGVNPHSRHLAEAHRIAAFLSSEESQEAHFDSFLVGPSNKNVAALDKVKNSTAFKAITEQKAHYKLQAPCPQSYWNAMGSLTEDCKTLTADQMQARIVKLAQELTEVAS